MKINIAREFIKPARILDKKFVTNSELLLTPISAQALIICDNVVIMQKSSYITVDFGKEINGSLLITYATNENAGNVRIRLGESVGEVNSELGCKNSGNDHSLRDFSCPIVQNGQYQTNNSGFRFARIDSLSSNKISIRSIYAILDCLDKNDSCKFECDDKLINKIYDTAAYTVRLCVQNGLIYDGIKRDRIVWAGDLHPEILSLYYTMGNIAEIKNSLKFLAETTPLNIWMNSIPSYAVWWLICLCDYYLFSGDIDFARDMLPYINRWIDAFDKIIDNKGEFNFDAVDMDFWEGNEYFFDWTTALTQSGEDGARELYVWGFTKTSNLLESLGYCGKTCARILKKLEAKEIFPAQKVQVAAMRVIAGRKLLKSDYLMLKSCDSKAMTSFMSYYILKAIAEKSSVVHANSIMKEYFGGMLARGATTFWEDFNTEWLSGSGRIDEFVKEGEKDLHGDFGNFCYKGYRHSFCHGWASGVCAYIIENIVGINIVSSGAKVIRIKPNMGELKYVTCSIPTSYGNLLVEIDNNSGEQKISIKAPKEVTIIS